MVAVLGLCLVTVMSFQGDVRADTDQYVVEFRDRAVDLEPFLQGYPYSGTRADLEFGQLLYFETTPDGVWLRVHEPKMGEKIDLASGRKVSDIDWATRSLWGGSYNPVTGKFYITSDEKNDEHMNVYAMDLATGEMEQVTFNDYTYAWGFSEDHKLLAYIARGGLQEPFNSCLRVRDLVDGEEREIFCDNGDADRFTWSKICFTPQNDAVILTVQHDQDRRTTSLARISTAKVNPQFDFLIPPRVMRYGLGLIHGWINNSQFLYTSSETGFDNVYIYDLESGVSTQITDFRDEVRSSWLLETDPPTVIVVLSRPQESEILLLEAISGEVLLREIVDERVGVVDAHGDSGIFSVTSLTSPLTLEWFRVRMGSGGKWELSRSPLANMPSHIEEKIVHLIPEKVSFPTFDTLEDGSPRMLHAFYLEPKNPPKDPKDRLVRVTAFYGGSNSYSKSNHIMAAAGIATMSPAPRGSWGFGAEFSALNDGDLGGDEIVDIFYAAKWLIEERGYEPHQIGVYGGSHGGYAVMRALTFPPETNGRGESFDFGFGLCHAGFSDLLTFYETCNIPDWIILEAGDPRKEQQKLLDRSPISHVERLKAPLLLTHGENDWRVPVEESRRFAQKAKALGKPVTYVEFPGQGHGIEGLPNTLTYYNVIFGFLESLDGAAASD
jgi:dipeptidyl aminopeptidase/acylaminoacyl peptidase